MNLSDVAEEIAARLDSIEGLRCFSYPPAAIHPPVAIVLNPVPGDIQYDQTYGRGMDRMTLPVILLVGRGNERAATKNIRPYLDGSGAKSIKAVLDSGAYASFDEIRVTTSGVDGVSWGGTEYQAALFDLDIAGQGRG